MKTKSFNVIQTLKTGLLCGTTAIIVSLMGMVESFNKKFIIHNILTMGQLLLIVIFLSACFITIKKSAIKTRNRVIFNSMLCGLCAGLVLSLLPVIGSFINLRLVLINASPNLFKILTFSPDFTQNLYIGCLLLTGFSTFCGFIAGIFSVFPKNISKLILIGALSTIIIGLFQDIIRLVLIGWDISFINRLTQFFFPFGYGLSLSGAIYLFFISCGLGLTWKNQKIQDYKHRITKSIKDKYIVPFFCVLLTGLIILPLFINIYICAVLTIIGIYIILGLGLNIVVGYAGLLDLGYVAFFAIGAYATAILTSTDIGFFNFNFWQALPVAILAGVAAGMLLGIPVLKMKGDYLAIATLGFGEIIRLLARSDFLKPILNGSHGISGFPQASIGSWVINDPKDNYYLTLFGCLLVLIISIRLNHSRIARAWKAMREDEDVAQAMGINLISAKLQAFGIGAGFSALGGAIFANKIGSVFPVSFNVIVSINLMCLIIIGGLGSIKGVILGAVLMMGLPELLREFGEFRYFFYGIGLITIMILKPEGLIPVK